MAQHPASVSLMHPLRTPADIQSSLLRKLCGSESCAHRAFSFDDSAVRAALRSAPLEGTAAEPPLLQVPLPDGSSARFLITEAPVLSPEMAVRFPEIHTYRGVSPDEPSLTARIDLSPAGFHAIVLSSSKTYLIDPFGDPGGNNYIAYRSEGGHGVLSCELDQTAPSLRSAARGAKQAAAAAGAPARTPDLSFPASPTSLRIYRTGVLASSTYSAATGGTEFTVTSAIVSNLNRVNAIFERDAAIRLQLVDAVVYTDAASQPFTLADESNSSAMAVAAHRVLTQRIGADRFDVGHAFTGDGGGGVALDLGIACNNELKGGGSSLGMATVTPLHWINLVAHEFGHQFAANHTMNASGVAGCKQGSYNAGTAFEPGSGTTTMSYVGLCNAADNIQDLQGAEDLIFHAYSIKEMLDYTAAGAGQPSPTCSVAALATRTNTPPKVAGPGDFTIPANTPFFLEASAADPDPEDAGKLTYTWDELDLGAANPGNEDDGTRPLFRSYMPSPNPRRYFPSMQYVLNNANNPPELYTAPFGPLGDGGTSAETKQFRTGEVLPVTNRAMRFRVTVRDNRPSDGMVTGALAFADSVVTVAADAGPFQVTAPNSSLTWAAGSKQTVTWNVNRTDVAPVNAANVRILLSTDGGKTFATVLADKVPNNGSAQVTLPAGVKSTTARIMVQGYGNIFFDVSDADFAIQ